MIDRLFNVIIDWLQSTLHNLWARTSQAEITHCALGGDKDHCTGIFATHPYTFPSLLPKSRHRDFRKSTEEFRLEKMFSASSARPGKLLYNVHHLVMYNSPKQQFSKYFNIRKQNVLRCCVICTYGMELDMPFYFRDNYISTDISHSKDIKGRLSIETLSYQLDIDN